MRKLFISILLSSALSISTAMAEHTLFLKESETTSLTNLNLSIKALRISKLILANPYHELCLVKILLSKNDTSKEVTLTRSSTKHVNQTHSITWEKVYFEIVGGNCGSKEAEVQLSVRSL